MFMLAEFHHGFFQVHDGVLKATKPFLLPNDRLMIMPSQNDEQEKDSREQGEQKPSVSSALLFLHALFTIASASVTTITAMTM
jgi:hypothetical protein